VACWLGGLFVFLPCCQLLVGCCLTGECGWSYVCAQYVGRATGFDAYLANNGVTVKCPGVDVGKTFTLGNTEYTRRSLTEPDGDDLVDVINEAARATTCTTGVTDMSDEAFGWLRINALEPIDYDITHFDTDAVTTFEDTIGPTFNQKIGVWNTSSVVSMRGMFENAAFNQYIGDWDTSNVEDMDYMFEAAADFDQDIGGWDTGKVESMNFMFEDAQEFNQNLENWTASPTGQCNYFGQRATAWLASDACGGENPCTEVPPLSTSLKEAGCEIFGN